MQYSSNWIAFPSHLTAPSVRSLSLLFILEEILSQFKKANGDQDLSFLKELFGLETPLPKGNITPDKLCFYCHILLKTSQVDGQNVLNILDAIRITLLQSRSDILQSKLGQEIVWKKGKEFLKIWRKKLSTLFSALTPFLREARTDENVLFFLLENKEIFNSYLGKKTIEQLLGKFFPQGEEYWHAVLHEGFHRRSFSKFFESKQHLLQRDTAVKTDECTHTS